MSNKAVPSTCRHETLIRSREYSLLQLEEKHLALTLSGFTLRKNYLRPLHGVMSGTRIRQKFAKKRRLRGAKSIFRKILTQLSCRVVAMQRSRKAINKIHHTWFTVARIIGIQRKTVWLKNKRKETGFPIIDKIEALGNAANCRSSHVFAGSMMMPIVCNPAKRKGSWPVSRILSWTVIHLDARLPVHSSNLPAGSASRIIACLFGLAPDGGYRVSP